MNRFRVSGALMAALVLIPSVSRAADPRPAGTEFLLGACATCRQQTPAVAGSRSGTLAGVWEGQTPSDPHGVLVRFFNAQGRPLAAERLVNRNLAADQYDPAVAATPNGFVVVWTEVAQGRSDILAQRFKASGTPAGGAIRVSAEGAAGAGVDYGPAVAAMPNGGFLVAWLRYTPPGAPAVMVRRYNASGKPLGGQVQVSTGLVKGAAPDVCALSNGGAAVAWASIDERRPFEPSLEGVSLRRLSPAGAPVGAAEEVIAAPEAEVASAAVSCGKAGAFAVAYELDRPGVTEESDIFVQRFTPQGAPAGLPLQVNATAAGRQKAPKLSHDPAGHFVVVWTSHQDDGYRLVARRIGAGGAPLSGEVVVELSGSASLRPLSPDVAHAGKAGGFVVTWQEGTDTVLGRRYVP